MIRDFDADIQAIQRIDAVPSILEVVCRTTGMGFAAIARRHFRSIEERIVGDTLRISSSHFMMILSDPVDRR